jgi:UDP-N-acetylmuramoylalanine--D-glutamate ligase
MTDSFTGRRVLVCGMMRSGQAAAKLLKDLGARVTAQDLKEADKIEWPVIQPDDAGIEFYLGRNPEEIVELFDLIVISPGIPQGLPFLEKAAALGIPVWGEIELAYRLCPCPVIAITGTNGKTTTTTLVGEILKNAGMPVEVVGNIGESFCGKLGELTPGHTAVAEISSFQLETVHTFKPAISAIINVTPDHLNRHKTMENYAALKARVFDKQDPSSFAVLNLDDPYCRKMNPPCKTVWFSSKEKPIGGAYYDGGAIRMGNAVIDMTGVRILTENALAAAAIGLLAGVSAEVIEATFKAFKGVAHRIEYVAEINGVEYYNDSKATNTDSAIKALEAMKRPIVLIAGGYDKQASFDEWVKLFPGKVKRLITMGATAEQIEAACRSFNYSAYERVNSLRDAVTLAAARAEAGDCVLLSPACASWDMFDNFEQRGELFKGFVREEH